MLLRLPHQFAFLEPRVRDHLRRRISRGKIQVNVIYLQKDTDGFEIDSGLVKDFISTLRGIGKELGLQDDLRLSHLGSIPMDIIRPKEKEFEPEVIWSHLKDSLDEAVDALLLMRENEGKRLSEEISCGIGRIREVLNGIDRLKERVVEEYRERLSKRVEEILGEGRVNSTRLEEEVVLFADRADINEEIVRLRSHLEQFEGTLTLRGPIGKRLDFLVQELSREINTITSKTSDLEIIQKGLLVKNELERLREQIQNIE